MELLQWIVSTCAGIAIGVGVTRLQFRAPHRKAEKALDDIIANTRLHWQEAHKRVLAARHPPSPLCADHRYVFHHVGVIDMGHKRYHRYAVYECRTCADRVKLGLHRKSRKGDKQ